MKPLKQTILQDPDNGLYGNCFQAVIASLLELPMDAVPNFLEGPTPTNWKTETNEWLSARGLVYFEVKLQAPWAEAFPGVSGLYHEMSGPSPRNKDASHSVVGRDGEVYFDPHPSDMGLDGLMEDWQYGFIIPKTI